MRITWLLESADQIWGGVKVALEDANWLHRRGHQVTVLSRSGPPGWMQVECEFRKVVDFRPEHVPPSDVIVGTYWTTVPWAAAAAHGQGVAVHYCQGYEGDMPEHAPLRQRIEAVYRLPGVRHVTVSPHLSALLRERFGAAPTEVVYTVDHRTHHPAPPRPAGRPVRVGLVGPYQVAWKDLATGYAACRLAHAAGLPIELVRVTNTAPHADELDLPFAVEWHQRVPPHAMGDIYRSLDVFLGTSKSADEGFFLPAIEAMACGVPTVLTDVPCFRGHGDGAGDDRFALFVPPGDAAAMAEALVLAASLPEVRATLRREGIALAARYHGDRHGEALERAFEAFLADARAAAETAPAGATAHLTVPLVEAGERLLEERRASAAARCFLAACCLDPADTDLRFRLAQAQEQAGDADGALANYDALVQRGVDDERLHTARGLLLHRRGRIADAAQAFRAALAVGNRSADAYNRLGVVLFQAGDLSGARNNFERALVLQPTHADAGANLQALSAP